MVSSFAEAGSWDKGLEAWRPSVLPPPWQVGPNLIQGVMRRDVDTGVFESHFDFQNRKQQRQLFWAVVDGYIRTKEVQPLITYVIDPEITPRRLGPEGIEFLVDVEHAAKKALGSPVLFSFWEKLINDEEIPRATEEKIIGKCARLFAFRGLLPKQYFRRIRRRQRRPGDGSMGKKATL